MASGDRLVVSLWGDDSPRVSRDHVGHVGAFVSSSARGGSKRVGGPRTLPSLMLGRDDATLNDLACCLKRNESLLLDPSVYMFTREVESYDETVHCLARLDKVIRDLAGMPSSVVPDGWQCVLYLNGHSDDGTLFHLLRETTTTILVHLEYILATWSVERWGSSVATKCLVLLCDFGDSYKWTDTMERWCMDESSRPESLRPAWDCLNVTLVTRRDVRVRPYLDVAFFRAGKPLGMPTLSEVDKSTPVVERTVGGLKHVFRYGCVPTLVNPFGKRRGHMGMFVSASNGNARLCLGDTPNLARSLGGESGPFFLSKAANDYQFLCDGTLSAFSRVSEYDDTLHCVFHLDQLLRGFAYITPSVLPPYWQCVVYLNGVSEDLGESFLLLKTRRDPTTLRHERVDGKKDHYSIDLDYILMTWLGIGPPARSEVPEPPNVEKKVLVLICDFHCSERWGERLKWLQTEAREGRSITYDGFPGLTIEPERFWSMNVVLVCSSKTNPEEAKVFAMSAVSQSF